MRIGLGIGSRTLKAAMELASDFSLFVCRLEESEVDGFEDTLPKKERKYPARRDAHNVDCGGQGLGLGLGFTSYLTTNQFFPHSISLSFPRITAKVAFFHRQFLRCQIIPHETLIQSSG